MEDKAIEAAANKLEELLNDYRMHSVQDEDGGGYPLTDKLSSTPTIESGQKEISLIVDYVINDVIQTYEAAKGDGWRPIDAAPKDGQGILAYNPVVGVYNTAFTTRFDLGINNYEGFPCGFWSQDRDTFPFGKWDCQPTHWMPLPTPPKSEA